MRRLSGSRKNTRKQQEQEQVTRTSDPSSTDGRRMRGVWWAVGAGGICWLATENSLKNPFILDDLTRIRDNPQLRSLSAFARSFLEPGRGMLTCSWSPLTCLTADSPYTTRRNDPSRPLTSLSFLLNFSLLGSAPWHFRKLTCALLAPDSRHRTDERKRREHLCCADGKADCAPSQQLPACPQALQTFLEDKMWG
eukprot:763703-Hanusia_phi.AAC.1